MKVLLDHNVDIRLRLELPGHLVMTARQMGWERLANGDLVRLAENGGFDVLVTADKNLYYQQNRSNRMIALVVLGANTWKRMQEKLERIVEAVAQSKPGSYTLVD